jgi:hypothetical protein
VQCKDENKGVAVHLLLWDKDMHEELKKVHETKPKYFIEHEKYEEEKYARYEQANIELKETLNSNHEKVLKELETIKESVAPGVQFIKGAQGTRWMVEFIVRNWLIVMVVFGIIGILAWVALKGVIRQL